MNINSYQTLPQTSVLKIIGDVNIVLNGLVEDSNSKENVLQIFNFALGAGSFTTCECIGETLVFNQTGYSCYLDKQEELVTHKETKDLKSPFLMGLEPNSSPSLLTEINYSEGLGLHDLFTQLEPNFQAYAFVGCLLFKKLVCAYLKKPPIFKENINLNHDKYWSKAEELPDCYTYLFGVVIRDSARNSFPPEMLQKAFYANPQEKNQDGMLSHTHAAIIEPLTSSIMNFKSDLKFYEKLAPNSVTGVRHIFTQSIVKEGLLALYNLKAIKG